MCGRRDASRQCHACSEPRPGRTAQVGWCIFLIEAVLLPCGPLRQMAWENVNSRYSKSLAMKRRSVSLLRLAAGGSEPGRWLDTRVLTL